MRKPSLSRYTLLGSKTTEYYKLILTILRAMNLLKMEAACSSEALVTT
jgi:hypothetical protein